MLRGVFVITALCLLVGIAQAQSVPPPITPSPDPNQVTSVECAQWRATISGGQPLSESELSRFVHCVITSEDRSIGPGVSLDQDYPPGIPLPPGIAPGAEVVR
jgi:hypothetical protein